VELLAEGIAVRVETLVLKRDGRARVGKGPRITGHVHGAVGNVAPRDEGKLADVAFGVPDPDLGDGLAIRNVRGVPHGRNDIELARGGRAAIRDEGAVRPLVFPAQERPLRMEADAGVAGEELLANALHDVANVP